MASKNPIPDLENKPEEIEIIAPASETLKDEIHNNPCRIELGQATLLPGLEPVSVFIYDVGVVFKLSEEQPRIRSKSFHVKREKAKAEKVDLGSVDKANIPQCIVIKWDDFVNCRFHETPQKSETFELEIISYEVFAVAKKMRYKKRQRSLLQFAPISHSSKEEIQTNWVDRITLTGRKFTQRNFASIREQSDDELLAKRRVLILLNPVSGKKTAMKIFTQQVEPFLNDACIEFELFVTQRANHAKQRLSKEDLDQWDGLLFMSGDGLLNEGLNGLLAREDANLAIQKPYGIIPCGSGNAIIGGVLHYSREDFSPLNAAFVFAKGLYGACLQPMDVGVCVQGERSNYFCLLLNWGFSADVDIESEVVRGIGELRFVIGALWRCFDRRIYRADISYLPFEDHTSKEVLGNENRENSTDEVKNDISAENDSVSAKPGENSSWIDIPGPFTNILVTLCPTLSHDLFCAPEHTFGCGYFTIINMSHANFTRMQILQMMDLMKEDKIENFNRVNFFRAKAVRLKPIYPPKGYLVFDGEVAPYEACEVSVTGHKMYITTLFERKI